MKRAVLFLLGCYFLFPMTTNTHGSEVKPAQSFSSSHSYEVENLEAVMHQEGLFHVSGVIRNKDAYPTTGYVVIYFTNDSDDVIAAEETIVNGKRAIDPGNTGRFELSKRIEEYKQIKKTFIEYVVQKKIITPQKPLITIGTKR
jgi:hypothetical protein